MKPTHWTATDIGLERQHNEDAYLWLGPENTAGRGYLWVVADGMGGEQAGDLASAHVVESFKQIYPICMSRGETPHAAMREAIEAANKRIIRSQERYPALRRMGSTVVALAIENNEAWIAHVGDSRCYWLHNGDLKQLTQDHTKLETMIGLGYLTRAESEKHPAGNVLTRAVGRHNMEIDYGGGRPLPLAGETFILCSDGLTGFVPHEVVCEAVRRLNARSAVEALLELARRHNGDDNTTVAVCRLGPPDPSTATTRDDFLEWTGGESQVRPGQRTLQLSTRDALARVDEVPPMSNVRGLPTVTAETRAERVSPQPRHRSTRRLTPARLRVEPAPQPAEPAQPVEPELSDSRDDELKRRKQQISQELARRAELRKSARIEQQFEGRDPSPAGDENQVSPSAPMKPEGKRAFSTQPALPGGVRASGTADSGELFETRAYAPQDRDEDTGSEDEQKAASSDKPSVDVARAGTLVISPFAEDEPLVPPVAAAHIEGSPEHDDHVSSGEGSLEHGSSGEGSLEHDDHVSEEEQADSERETLLPGELTADDALRYRRDRHEAVPQVSSEDEEHVPPRAPAFGGQGSSGDEAEQSTRGARDETVELDDDGDAAPASRGIGLLSLAAMLLLLLSGGLVVAWALGVLPLKADNPVSQAQSDHASGDTGGAVGDPAEATAEFPPLRPVPVPRPPDGVHSRDSMPWYRVATPGGELIIDAHEVTGAQLRALRSADTDFDALYRGSAMPVFQHLPCSGVLDGDEGSAQPGCVTPDVGAAYCEAVGRRVPTRQDWRRIVGAATTTISPGRGRTWRYADDGPAPPVPDSIDGIMGVYDGAAEIIAASEAEAARGDLPLLGRNAAGEFLIAEAGLARRLQARDLPAGAIPMLGVRCITDSAGVGADIADNGAIAAGDNNSADSGAQNVAVSTDNDASEAQGSSAGTQGRSVRSAVQDSDNRAEQVQRRQRRMEELRLQREREDAAAERRYEEEQAALRREAAAGENRRNDGSDSQNSESSDSGSGTSDEGSSSGSSVLNRLRRRAGTD